MRISESVIQLAPFRPPPSDEFRELQDALDKRFEQLIRAEQEIRRLINGKLGVGFPDRATPNGQPDNLHVSWVQVSMTAAAQTLTVTHNLDLPVSSSGGAFPNNLPNVRWLVAGWLLGDLTGANAAPAAPAAFPGVGVMWVKGDAVTVNAIDLRFYTNAANLTPSATAPLAIDLIVLPAVS